jgi:hypothetical protein
VIEFPEGYGFAPTKKVGLIQDTFFLEIGFYTRVTGGWRRDKLPYKFTPVGRVMRDRGELHGYIDVGPATGTIMKGTIQDICTAICTAHRLTGEKKC